MATSAVVQPGQVTSAIDTVVTTSKGAGYNQQLAQLAHQVGLLEEKLYAAKVQQRQRGESSGKVRIITQLRDTKTPLLMIGM